MSAAPAIIRHGPEESGQRRNRYQVGFAAKPVPVRHHSTVPGLVTYLASLHIRNPWLSRFSPALTPREDFGQRMLRNIAVAASAAASSAMGVLA